MLGGTFFETNTGNPMKHILSSLALAAAAVTLVGCAQTAQPGRSTPLAENLSDPGFLGDIYPKMTQGKDGESLMLYRNPKYDSAASFVRYTKVMIEPIKLYAGADSPLQNTPKEQTTAIVDGFYTQLREQLAKDYQMVDKAGPDTLLIAVAVVDAVASDTTAKAASYIPIPLGLPGAKAAAMQATSQTTGKPPFSGQVTVEGKMSDAETGEVISAGIDRRVGARRPIIGLFESSTYDAWSDVTAAEQYWAELLRYRLCMRRGASNCVKPAQ